MTTLDGKVGFSNLLGDNTENEFRLSKTGEQVVQLGNARYDELVSRGKVFCASNQAAKAITPFATSITTGLILYNPPGSNVRLALLDLLIAQAVAATTAICTISLAAPVAATVPASVSALAARNALVGSANTPSAVAYDGATLGTADQIVRNIWSPSVSATATTGIPGLIKDEINGELGVLPGWFVALSATTAMSAMSSIFWTEIPLA